MHKNALGGYGVATKPTSNHHSYTIGYTVTNVHLFKNTTKIDVMAARTVTGQPGQLVFFLFLLGVQ